MTARGFTLFELLVVLTVLGLVAALGVPKLSNAFTGPGVRAAALDLAAVLRSARMQAVAESRPALFRFDPETRRAAIGNSYRGAPLAADLVLSFEGPDPGAPFAGIAFFPDGTSSGGRILVADGGQGFLIAVDWLTGRTRVDAR